MKIKKKIIDICDIKFNSDGCSEIKISDNDYIIVREILHINIYNVIRKHKGKVFNFGLLTKDLVNLLLKNISK